MKQFLCFVVGLFALASASAQVKGAPADVPKDHWAYEAVTTLFKLGILHGYPDGLFHGSRSTSRFEMAATLEKLQLDLADQISKLSRGLKAAKASGKQVSKADLAEIAKSIVEIKSQVDRLQKEADDLHRRFDRMGQGLANLRKSLTDSPRSPERTGKPD